MTSRPPLMTTTMRMTGMDDTEREVPLLIDGDIIAFTAAAAVQNLFEDEWGFVMPIARRQEGEAVVDNMLSNLKIAFKSTHMRVALTDPVENFRRSIWPEYKASRKALH